MEKPNGKNKKYIEDVVEGFGNGIKYFIGFSAGVPLGNYIGGHTINLGTVFMDQVVPVTSSFWLMDGVVKRNWAETLEAGSVYFTKLGLDIGKALEGDFVNLAFDLFFLPVAAVFKVGEHVYEKRDEIFSDGQFDVNLRRYCFDRFTRDSKEMCRFVPVEDEKSFSDFPKDTVFLEYFPSKPYVRGHFAGKRREYTLRLCTADEIIDRTRGVLNKSRKNEDYENKVNRMLMEAAKFSKTGKN